VTDHDAVVYDLDNTLVTLAVDWDAVRREAAAALEEHGVEADGDDLWSLLEIGDEHGRRDLVEDVITEYERDGARESERLPLADALPHGVPVGVCSLNCEAACRLALDVHDLAAHVDAVVGRDTVATEKPDPEPLLATLRRLDVEPDGALFVGDGERDEKTAANAGVPFRYESEYRATP
jgi:phosphoglycolate phosphatase